MVAVVERELGAGTGAEIGAGTGAGIGNWGENWGSGQEHDGPSPNRAREGRS